MSITNAKDSTYIMTFCYYLIHCLSYFAYSSLYNSNYMPCFLYRSVFIVLLNEIRVDINRTLNDSNFSYNRLIFTETL